MKTIYFLSFALSLSSITSSQNRYDVVIDEIMADPTPQVGLPGNEWLELKNTTTSPINLQNWRLGDATGQSGPMPNFILQPDSFVIVSSASAAPAMSAFGTTLSVTSFPSLDNTGDQLFLKDANGKIIHAVSYSVSWYQNSVKANGGWTLEMIDTKSPCAGNNWKASVDPNGGTPGKKNSVDAMNTDQTPPSLLRTYTIDSVTIIAVFDEPIDSSLGAAIANYTIDGGLTIISVTTLSPLFDRVQLKLNSKMSLQTVYNLSVLNITDCKGNSVGVNNKAKAGLPEEMNSLNMVVNEILFNPRSNADDYVEFYNRSNKIFDASKMYVANRSSNIISSITSISTRPWLIFPGDYIVSTENMASLQTNYLVKNPDNVLEVSSLPSFPDDNGFVLLLNSRGDVTDEVDYDHSWHFKLIDNVDGVALERIDPDEPSQDANNWHSAASAAGYGTPTY
ncbi:MAG TPA: lamin tail domain-containing protein, partial [Chitinophagaceae bacterium]|nr:lamin tail domain-containing protein [Chitinophagaceae bacterium]